MKILEKFYVSILLVLVMGIFSCEDPNAPTSSFTVTISGQVLNLSNAPQDSVQLILNNPFRNTDTTRADGTFNISFTSDEKDEISTTLRFHHLNNAFIDTTVSIVYSSTKKTISVGEMRMKGVTSEIDSVLPPRPSARAGAIIFLKSQYSTISIRGSGGTDATNLTFEARDSSGTPVDINNSLMVRFKIVSRPDSLVELSLDSIKTNKDGQVSVLLTGGLKAGLAQIQASAVVKNSKDTTKLDTIKSAIATIPIFGGLPDSSHFTIGPSKFNVPGGVVFGERVAINVLVGDKFGNHAQPGIPVYFTTTGGQIKGSEVISEQGQLSVDLVTGNPFPPNGIAVVTAEIPINDGNNINSRGNNKVLSKYIKGTKKSKVETNQNFAASTMRRTTQVLFSGPSVVTIGNSFLLSAQTDTVIYFTVSDPLGNPLSEGTTIKVTGVGFDTSGIKLSGNLDVRLPDTYDPGWTQFSIIISDQRTTKLTQLANLSLSVEVNSPNGNVKRTVSGVVAPVGYVPPGPSTNAKFITFASSQFPSLSISGSGGIESTNLTFDVRDSLGRLIDALNTTTVLFKLVSDPTLGVKLNVDSTSTSSSGKAIVLLTSGNKAGMAQVRAMLKSDTTIKSSIVSIPVFGGLPDSSRFTVTAEKINLPGGVRSGDRTNINVLLGDKFGNPPQPGIPIYFSTNGGQIEGATSSSNDGSASVEFTTGSPYPPAGIATVTAEIPIDVDGNIVVNPGGSEQAKNLFMASGGKYKSNSSMATLKRSIEILFTGPSRITANDTDFVIPVQTDKIVNFIVSDPNGYPLSGGSRVTISGIGFQEDNLIGNRILLLGNTDMEIPDTKDPSWTQFSIGISDRRTENLEESKEIALAIDISSANGNVRKLIRGYLGSKPADTTGIPPTQRTAAQIKFDKVSTQDIFVSGVGGVETARLDYTVLDSLGYPINLNNRVGATFSLLWFPNTFADGGTAPSLVTVVDSSDNQGRIGTTIVSGTQAGVVQLIATINLPSSKIITSQPIKVTVHAGFPDQNHFTIATPTRNFPGLDMSFVTRSITVQVADKYSNPVMEGTAVYFNTSHGTITTGGNTNQTGFVSNTLYSANPFPAGIDTLQPDPEILSFYPSTRGFSRVYARTLGKDGAPILDSILFLWTGSPRFTNTGQDTFTVSNGGTVGPLTFTIDDRFGHPLSANTSIAVTASAGKLSGTTQRTLPDILVGGLGITTFRVFIGDDDAADTDPPVNVDVTVTVNHPIYGSYQFLIASGTVD